MNKNELQVGTTAEQRTTAESGTSVSLEQNGLLSALSPEESKWYERIKNKLFLSKRDYYCSWWLRCDYEDEEKKLTTTKINYWLTKLVKKGYLTKRSEKSYTAYYLTDAVPITR